MCAFACNAGQHGCACTGLASAELMELRAKVGQSGVHEDLKQQ